ncbi:hypothetical protein KY345_02330 [Candidatus Woesearchaeota archaeon]|nr:hypothetical protein [Candidatus Woesearchaeota archaeon]
MTASSINIDEMIAKDGAEIENSNVINKHVIYPTVHGMMRSVHRILPKRLINRLEPNLKENTAIRLDIPFKDKPMYYVGQIAGHIGQIFLAYKGVEKIVEMFY